MIKVILELFMNQCKNSFTLSMMLYEFTCEKYLCYERFTFLHVHSCLKLFCKLARTLLHCNLISKSTFIIVSIQFKLD